MIGTYHGNYQGIIRWFLALEKFYPNKEFLPITNASVEHHCGYIYRGTVNVISHYDKYLKVHKV